MTSLRNFSKSSQLLRPPDQPLYLLHNLKDLRDGEILTDVTIVAENRQFKAHRLVLAASSDYFRAMFTSENMIETTGETITLHGVPSATFKLLLDYIYTSEIDVNEANVDGLLSAAMYLQMVLIVDKCADFLVDNLTVENCLDVLNVAEEYALGGMRERVYRYVSNRITAIANMEFWAEFKPSQIESLVSMDFIMDTPESGLLTFVLKWFLSGYQSEIQEKLRHAHRILSKFRFEHISRYHLSVVLDNQILDTQNDRLLLRMVEQKLKTSDTAPGADPTFATFNSRGTEMALLRIGGFSEYGITNQIFYLSEKLNEWIELTSIPHHEQCNYAAAVFENNLYVVGGCFNQSLQEIIHPYGFQYDPLSDRWTRIPAMRVERCRFTLTVCNRKLYAVGGAIVPDDTIGTKTCEFYNPFTKNWEFIESLPSGRTQHAAVAITTNGSDRLYVIGGMNEDVAKDSVFCYDFDGERRSWRRCAPMLTPRIDHAALAYDGKLYVCGGWYESNDGAGTPRRMPSSTVDVYDCATDSWSVLTRLPAPRTHASAVAIGPKIYVVGGFNINSMFHKEWMPIDVYEITTDRWSEIDKPTSQFWEHVCVSMYVPKGYDREAFDGRENPIKKQKR